MPDPFRVSVPDAVLGDLHDRLGAARRPAGDREPGGIRGPRSITCGSCWRTGARSSTGGAGGAPQPLDQFTEDIDGQRIHFLHLRSPQPGALPRAAGPRLARLGRRVPRRHRPAHRPAATAASRRSTWSCPSLPGYGFSGPTTEPRLDTRAAWPQPSRSSWRGSATTATARRAATGARSCPRTWPTSTPDRVAACTSTSSPCRRPRARPRRSTPRSSADLAACSAFRRTRSGLPADPGHQAPDARLRAGGLAGRAGGVDRREVPGVERLRRRRRAQLHQGPAAHQHHAVLGDRHRYLVGAPLTRAPGGPGRRPGRPDHRADRRRPVSGEITRTPRGWAEQRYNITHWAELPRGWPLRRHGGPRPVRRRHPPVLQHRRLTS